MPCLSSMSLSFTRKRLRHLVKASQINISTNNTLKVNHQEIVPRPAPILWTPPFKVPHPRHPLAAQKYIYMPGTGTQPMLATAIPGYNARQVNTGPVAMMINQAKANYADHGTYGEKPMQPPTLTKPALKPRQLKKQRKAQAKLEKAAHKAKRRRKMSRSDLINAESRLGSTLFGPIPDGHRREFFHDQQNVWIWHEGWLDDRSHTHQFTVRYEVRPSGVYKKLSAGKYVQLQAEELDNFRHAARAYLDLIKRQLYAKI